ncbi:MAG: hypothetical protein Tp1102MES731781_51 [Prokaryotic dsDNA virus sp.]|nr:MAG: hypothetical protein Tp1102MES731781_51 [Prokaryotic dsDNA virus sp.]|tara:strand:+ start:5406 stop:5774 length:369 start_codon:yes stop_codon:yes gene_type:complete
MAHYAKVDKGIVKKVIVAEADFFNNYVDTTPGEWVQTSYNTRGGIHYQPNTNTPSDDQSLSLRKNYAGVGYHYDGIGFYMPQPYPSWTLNTSTYYWEPPVAFPTEDGKTHTWDETNKQWIEN